MLPCWEPSLRYIRWVPTQARTPRGFEKQGGINFNYTPTLLILRQRKTRFVFLIMFIPQTIRYDWLEGPSQGSFIVFNHKELFGTKDLHSRIGLVWAKISTAPLNPWREFPAKIFDIATNVLKWTVIYLCIHRCLYIGSLVFLLFFDKLLTFLWLYCFYNF